MNLFQYAFVVVTFCSLVLSFSHMDYYIAKYNIEMYSEVQKKHSEESDDYIYDEYEQDLYDDYDYDEYDMYDDYFYHKYADYNYILHLSVDAVPAISGHEKEVSGYRAKKEDWLKKHSPWAEDLGDGITIRKFNVSRWIATRILDK